jgi:hypothetical protein
MVLRTGAALMAPRRGLLRWKPHSPGPPRLPDFGAPPAPLQVPRRQEHGAEGLCEVRRRAAQAVGGMASDLVDGPRAVRPTATSAKPLLLANEGVIAIVVGQQFGAEPALRPLRHLVRTELLCLGSRAATAHTALAESLLPAQKVQAIGSACPGFGTEGSIKRPRFGVHACPCSDPLLKSRRHTR